MIVYLRTKLSTFFARRMRVPEIPFALEQIASIDSILRVFLMSVLIRETSLKRV